MGILRCRILSGESSPQGNTVCNITKNTEFSPVSTEPAEIKPRANIAFLIIQIHSVSREGRRLCHMATV